MAETPNLSRVLTLNDRCSSLPPLSASNISGLVVTSNKSPKLLNLDEKSNDWLSGLPLTLESVKLEDHIESNCSIFFPLLYLIFSAIKPDKGLWHSKTLTKFLFSRSLLKIEILDVGVKLLITLDLIELDEIFFVYLISINLPPHFFKVSITCCLAFT